MLVKLVVQQLRSKTHQLVGRAGQVGQQHQPRPPVAFLNECFRNLKSTEDFLTLTWLGWKEYNL